MTTRETVERASHHIGRRDAETLLLHLLGRDRAWWLAHPEAETPANLERSFDKLVHRRSLQEPLQYITGHQEFFGLNLQVTPAVLIPRPETELLIEAVLAWARENSQPAPRLLDVGTGSGAIALALAANLPKARLTALDVSGEALAVAKANAARLGLADRVRFVLSDLLDAFAPELARGERVDAIVSNPPYVPDVDAPAMQPEVRDFEPHVALFAGPDGLAIYRRLIPQAMMALRPSGLLALEFGFGQRDGLAALLHRWKDVRFLNDLAGIPRIALATRP